MLLSVPFVYFLVPETKGIPLEDTNSLFREGLKPWKAHAVVLAEVGEKHQLLAQTPPEDVKTSLYEDERV